VPSDFHLFGPLKKHLAGKRFAKDADMKQAVTYWLSHLTQISSAMQYEPCCHGGTKQISMVTKWRSDLYHLLPCAMYTLKSEQFFGIRLFATIFL
jgi:hypothetical protein